MRLEEKLVKDFLSLPDDKKIEVMDFIEFLKSRVKVSVEDMMDDIIHENRKALEDLAK